MGYDTYNQEAPRDPRRIRALFLFVAAELMIVSFDPAIALIPSVLAFALGSIALTQKPAVTA